MNTEHLRAFVWLRYRLRVNQLRRGGATNAVILGVVAVAVVTAAVGSGIAGFALGLFALADAPPVAVLGAWGGAVAGFLFVWLVGLMADLQRTEALSVEKVLHLPVSPAGAFAVNYVSSLASVTLAVFVPGFVGLALGLAGSRGAAMLLVLPALAAFLFAVTALTYQFQGWLAALMANPRRRRTVVVTLTLGFILLANAPQLLNVVRPWGTGADVPAVEAARQADMAAAEAAHAKAGAEARAALDAKQTAAKADVDAGRLTSDGFRDRLDQNGREYKTRLDQNGRDFKARLDAVGEEHAARLNGADAGGAAARAEALRAKGERYERLAWLAAAVLPPGWLPLAAAGLADGNPLPALLGTLGFAAVGALAMWRAYRTTVRLVTGAVADAGGTGAVEAGRTGARREPSGRVTMTEWRLPGVGEHAAAVAAAGLRSLLRAPEAKLVLLAPLMFVVVFGSLAASLPGSPPELVRPLMAAGGVSLVMLTAVQLVGNQFGYDRGGFRAFVLAPVPRRDVLLGKNLAAAPLLLGLGWLAVVLVGSVFPMRIDHLLAALLQAAAMFLVFCMMANALSVLAPLPVAAGAMQAGGVRMKEALGQLVVVALLPVAFAPTFVPLAAEALLTEAAGVPRGWPVALALSAAVLAAAALLYRRVLTWEGDLLARREQEVLRVVTSKEE